MLNFAKLKNFIVQPDLETKNKTFSAIDLKVKRIQMFTLHCIAYGFSLYTPFIQYKEI